MKSRSNFAGPIICIAVAAAVGCGRHNLSPTSKVPAVLHVADTAPYVAETPSIEDLLGNSIEVQIAELKRQVRVGSRDEKLQAVRKLEELIPVSQGAVGALAYIATHEEGAVSYTAAVALETNERFRANRERNQARIAAAANDPEDETPDPVAEKIRETKGSVAALIERLQSKDDAARLDAAESLKKLRGKEARTAVPALMTAISDPSPEVRKVAVQALALISQRGVIAVNQAVSGEPARIHALCNVVRKWGIAEVDAAPALVYALGVDDEAARLDAAWTLRSLTDPSIAAVQRKFANLSDPTFEDKPNVTVDQPPALLSVVRERALDVIRQTRGIEFGQVNLLLNIAADDSDTDAVTAALDAVAAMGPEVLPLLELQMEQEDVLELPIIRCLAAVSHRAPKAVDLLVSYSRSKELPVQTAAAQAMGTLDEEAGRRAAPALAALLATSKGEGVQREALQALAKLGPVAEAASPEVKSIINHPDRSLRQEAIYTLSRIAPKSDEAVLAVMELRGAANDSEGRKRAIDALLTLDPANPGQSFVPALSNLLDDPDNDLRLKVLKRLVALGAAAQPAARRVARIVDNDSAEIRAAAIITLLSIDPDDRSLAAALIAAVHRKDDDAVEKMAGRVAGSERAKNQSLIKLRQIEQSDSDATQQAAARRAILAISAQ